MTSSAMTLTMSDISVMSLWAETQKRFTQLCPRNRTQIKSSRISLGPGWVLTHCGPNDAIGRQWTESTLAQAMAYCLRAPSHYLDQCFDLSSVRSCRIHRRALSWKDLKIPISKTRLKMTFLESHSDLPGANELNHDDVIKWKHFPRNWPCVRGIHRSPVNSPHKGQWRGALMFSLICVCINDSVNNREAGDLRRYRAHSDVIVMSWVTYTMAHMRRGTDMCKSFVVWFGSCFGTRKMMRFLHLSLTNGGAEIVYNEF